MLKAYVSLITLAVSSCYSVSAFANTTVSFGRQAIAVASHTVAVGDNARAEKTLSVSLGSYATAEAYDSVAIGHLAYTNREHTVSFGSTLSRKQLINIAPGTEDNDAVTVKQLQQSKHSIISENNKKTDAAKAEIINMAATYTNSAKNEAINTSAAYTNSAKNEAINTSTQYTDTKFRQLDKKTTSQVKQNTQRIDSIEKKINVGIAGVTAISSIPYVTANNFSFGVGIGNYKNGNAVAVGAQYTPYGNTNLRVNTSFDSNNNSVIGAGVAIGW